jgi:hypothetical protein
MVDGRGWLTRPGEGWPEESRQDPGLVAASKRGAAMFIGCILLALLMWIVLVSADLA